MQFESHNKVTGFSGNEIFCLKKIGYEPGQLCLGNSVLALGILKGIGSGLSNLAGGEVEQITQLVHEGRKHAIDRMLVEAKQYGGVGLAGVTFNIVNHVGNIEFIATGSTIHQPGKTAANEQMTFSTSASGQELYCQQDAGFHPISFVFSNIAYSIGVGGNILGTLRSLKRGEVPHFTEIFNRTRHLALERIQNEAKALKANAVIGIQTSIIPLLGAQEMTMTGTASTHPALNNYLKDPVTCDMTNEELWNLVNLGYLPIRLVIGVSVCSLGLTTGIQSFFRSIVGGQVQGLSDILYEAREKALARIQEDAQQCNADEVVGVKTRVYDLGGGLVEFMVMGTAVKKIDGITTKTDQLLPQAIIQERDTFVESSSGESTTLNKTQIASAKTTQRGPISIIASVAVIAVYVLIQFFHR